MNASEKFLYLVAGTGIGAALGILFAPRSGQEMRTTIAEKMNEGKKFVLEQGGAAGTVRNIMDRGKRTFNESVENVKNRFNESIEAGAEEYQAQRSSIPKRGIY